MSGYSPLIETLLELVRIDSESFNERRVADYIIGRLKCAADEIIEDDAGAKLGGNAGNLIVRLKGARPDFPTIMLNAHMDTVQPGIGIEPVVEGDIIRSAGDTILGSDDKAGVALIIEIVRQLKDKNIPHGDLLLVFTIAEEIGIKGAARLDPKLLKADFGYVLDCTHGPGCIFIGSPSHEKITATVRGRAAHAGIEPEKGISAIRAASLAISRMTLGRIDDETTANVGVIHGGHATNIVPDTVTVEAEARSHDRAKLERQVVHMVQALESAAAETGAKIEFVIEREYSSYRLAEDMPIVKLAMKAARAAGIEPELRMSGGGSDANVFNALGLPAAPLGTAMRKAHTKEEEISISELEGVLDYVMEIVKNPV
jgi:tripeptide aminopeptidase